MLFTGKEELAAREEPGQTAADHISSDIFGIFFCVLYMILVGFSLKL